MLTIYDATNGSLHVIQAGMAHLPSVGDRFILSADHGEPIVTGVVTSVEYGYDHEMGEEYFVTVDESKSSSGRSGNIIFEYDGIAVERQGDRVVVSQGNWEIVAFHIFEGGVKLDTDWAASRRTRDEHHSAWFKFVSNLGISVRAGRALIYRNKPPLTEFDFIAYTRDILKRKLKGIGPAYHKEIADALDRVYGKQ